MSLFQKGNAMGELDCCGVGVATADAELRTVGAKGTPVCSVNLAFNRSYKNSDGGFDKEVCFLRAQVWGARAETMAELVKKGQPVYVKGHMKQDTWDDRETGQKRVSFSLNLRDFQLCTRQAKKKVQDESKPVNVAENSAPSQEDDDDMPF
jgi:single-strand DNA-binding protein